MKKIFTFFAAMFAVVALNAQSVDYQLLGFIDNTDDQNPITQLNIAMDQDLDVNMVVINNGPNEMTNSDSLLFDLTLAGISLGNVGWLGSELAADGLLAVGTGWIATLSIFDAATMDQYADYIGTEFELCFTVSTKVATDVDNSNNSACIQVNRGVTALNEIAENEISVYPNPATSVINVANAQGAQISVFDMNGRMIANVESASANQAIDAASFAKGMYIVRIVDGQNVTTKKVSVVR